MAPALRTTFFFPRILNLRTETQTRSQVDIVHIVVIKNMSDPVVEFLRKEETKLKVMERNKEASKQKVESLLEEIKEQEKVLVEKQKAKSTLEKEKAEYNNW